MEMIMQNLMMQQPSAPLAGKEMASGMKGQPAENGKDTFAQMMEAAGGEAGSQIDGPEESDGLVQSLAGQFMQNMQMNPLLNVLPADPAGQAEMPVAEIQVEGNIPGMEMQNMQVQDGSAQTLENPVAGNMASAVNTDTAPKEGTAADQPVIRENIQAAEGSARPVTDVGNGQPSAAQKDISQGQSGMQQAYAGMASASEGNPKTESETPAAPEQANVSQVQTASATAASRSGAPVQQNTAASETLYVNVSDRAENIQNLTELIKNAVDSQVKELEIQLEPANLGKITVKAVYESGKAAVVISCTNQAALEALSGKAAELGGLLQERMGGQTEIIVDQPQQQYLNQDGRNGNQESREEQHRQQKQDGRPQTGDFLEQLRLGLI